MSGYQHLLTSARSLAMIFQAAGFNRGINDDEKHIFFEESEAQTSLSIQQNRIGRRSTAPPPQTARGFYWFRAISLRFWRCCEARPRDHCMNVKVNVCDGGCGCCASRAEFEMNGIAEFDTARQRGQLIQNARRLGTQIRLNRP